MEFIKLLSICILLIGLELNSAAYTIDCGPMPSPTVPPSVCTNVPSCMPSPYTGGAFLGTISTLGKAFVTSNNGKRFVVRGVVLTSPAGTSEPVDPLVDANYDNFNTNILPKLQSLGVNLIRVFDIDPSQPHDRIMSLLQMNGIYVIAEVFSNRVHGSGDNLTYINNINPNYTVQLQQHVMAVVDAMARYENLFSFEVGNELIFPGNMFSNVNKENGGGCDPTTTNGLCAVRTRELEKFNAAITKNIMRDIKAYYTTKVYRKILLGQAMEDTSQNTIYTPQPTRSYPYNLFGSDLVAQYYACGDYADNGADYIGINSYAYVPGPGVPVMTAYDQYAGGGNPTAYWQGTVSSPIPYFLSESGANDGGVYTRTWGITPVFYNNHLVVQNNPPPNSVYLQDVLSGETAYAFWAEDAPPFLGLYCIQPNTQTQTWCGGANNLACQNTTYASTTVGFPTSNPTGIDCPNSSNFSNFPTAPSAATQSKYFNFSVTIDNSSGSVPMLLVGIPQSRLYNNKGSQLQPIPAGTIIQNVQVSSDNALIVLYVDTSKNPPAYYSVCTVPVSSLSDGMIIATDVQFGSQCNITPAPRSFLQSLSEKMNHLFETIKMTQH